MNEQFDTEFKLYLRNKGMNIDPNIFDVKFNPPQNFAAYRQAEMDTARVNVFGTLVGVPYLSKRFAMKRFLGLTSEEVAENEKLWKEENVDSDTELSASAELRSAGITANTISGDLGSINSNTAELSGEQPAPEAGAPESTTPTPPPA
jgi:hypothetical protein